MRTPPCASWSGIAIRTVSSRVGMHSSSTRRTLRLTIGWRLHSRLRMTSIALRKVSSRRFDSTRKTPTWEKSMLHSWKSKMLKSVNGMARWKASITKKAWPESLNVTSNSSFYRRKSAGKPSTSKLKMMKMTMAATKMKLTMTWKEVVQCNHLLVRKSLKINKSDSDKVEEFTESTCHCFIEELKVCQSS